MYNSSKVAFFDGIGISKIHFEQEFRHIDKKINYKTVEYFSNAYGIFDIKISESMLNQGKIALEYISGFMKDGTIFDAPNNDMLPEPLEINHENSGATIFLNIVSTNNNTIDFSTNNNLPNAKYNVFFADINSRIDDSQINNISKTTNIPHLDNTQIALASLNLKLSTKKQNNHISLPICKIVTISSDSKITLDNNFIHTCINIKKLTLINSFISEMQNTLKMQCDELYNSLSEYTHNIFLKWYFIFSYIYNKEILHPEYLYEKLIEFQADLFLSNKTQRFHDIKFINYYHEDLSSTFIPLIDNIRLIFSKIIRPNYLDAKIIDKNYGFYDCIFNNQDIFNKSIDLFLVLNIDNTNNFDIHSQIKIHRQSKIKNIVQSQSMGIELEQVYNIPSALPLLQNHIYLRIKQPKLLSQENIIGVYTSYNVKSIRLYAIFKD